MDKIILEPNIGNKNTPDRKQITSLITRNDETQGTITEIFGGCRLDNLGRQQAAGDTLFNLMLVTVARDTIILLSLRNSTTMNSTIVDITDLNIINLKLIIIYSLYFLARFKVKQLFFFFLS